MRKFIVRSLLFIVMLLLSTIYYLPSTAFATGATLSLSPATGSFNKGCTFSADINLDTGGAQTDGTDAIIFYDPTRLSTNTQSITNGTIYSDYPGNNVDTSQGKITISGLSSVSTAFSGTGVLATISFTVLDTAPAGVTQVNFDFDPNDKAKTIDSNVVERGTVSDILNQVTNGSYTIGTGSCGVQPTLTLTPTKTPVSGQQGGVGGTVPTKAPLPTAGSFSTTFMIGALGSILTILGIIGLSLL
ncbi:hypothetical protein HY385_03150 [Candidatus Daviesbacteria bacterium]|nr:hypothetical protein [Candidatus Daviesbacteria bacterium]